MSINVAMIEAMEAEGLSADAILRILKAGGKKADNTAAERQRRYREKKNGHAVTVTRDTPPNDKDILTPPVTPNVVSNETTSPAANDPGLKPEHVLEVWNTQAPEWGLRPVRKFTPQRRRKVSARIRENTIDEFTEAIGAIGRSPFLMGQNDRGWRADFDWMLEPRNFTKLLEGTYDR